MARPFGTKKIESPEKMWELFHQYKEEVKSKPFLIKDWVGKDGFSVDREKERPLSLQGFEGWLSLNEILSDISKYFEFKDESYKDYFPISRAIKAIIASDQIEGGMAGVYNPSLTARLNSLAEKQETDITSGGEKIVWNEVKTYDIPKEES